MVRDIETRLSYQGMKMDMYLNMMGKTMEEFRKEGEEQAKEAVKTRLVLEAIVKAENIEAEETKVTERVEEMAKAYGRKAEELQENNEFMTYVKNGLANEAAIDFIVANAKIK